YGAVGRSMTAPVPSCEAVIQRVSPATTTVVPSAGVAAALVVTSGGKEPVIHASQAPGISAEASPVLDADGCTPAGHDARVVGACCAAGPRAERASARAPPTTRTASIAPNASRRRRTVARAVIAVRLAIGLRE